GQARQLLRAEVVEIVTFARHGAKGTLWRYDGERVESEGGEAVRAAQEELARLIEPGDAKLLNYPIDSRFLRLRGAREAVVAPLAVEGEVVGAIAAYDRLGEVCGFADSDVNLLETVANHASMALHNETLIARLRHEAMHDALTGLPNRAQLMSLAT